MKEKEGANNGPGALRRETWIHPGGRRVRRTTSSTAASDGKCAHSDSEELSQLSSVEVNISLSSVRVMNNLSVLKLQISK